MSPAAWFAAGFFFGCLTCIILAVLLLVGSGADEPASPTVYGDTTEGVA